MTRYKTNKTAFEAMVRAVAVLQTDRFAPQVRLARELSARIDEEGAEASTRLIAEYRSVLLGLTRAAAATQSGGTDPDKRARLAALRAGVKR